MTLETLIKFFKSDIEIKKTLVDLEPQEELLNDGEKYYKMLDNGLDSLKYHICCMLNISEPHNLEIAEQFFEQQKRALDACGDDYYRLVDFYHSLLIMRPKLIEEVGYNCIGYSPFSGVSILKAKTVNEMAHIIHQNLTNNEWLYKRMPVIKSKENSRKKKITLYGDETDLANNIYDSFYSDFNVGTTDILSFEGQFLIMVRDRGHALSIEIEKEREDEYYIRYHIPKIINIDMVRNLKGIGYVPDGASYARGIFKTTKENLPLDLVEFIEKVPTDADIIKPKEMTA